MPEKPSYENIANYAWPLIYRRMTKSDPATTFLGPAGTAILQPHFPPGWLTKVKIGTYVGGVPTAVLSDLWTAMGYSDEPSFSTECGKVHANLYKVLRLFTNGAGFDGITYDTTIYLKDSEADDLSLVVHELVHSLQWFHFAKTGFLSRYIEGFANVFPYYKKNPAEIRAYGEQGNFTKAANAELAKVSLGPLSSILGSAIRTATDTTGASSGSKDLPKAITALKNATPLGITAVTAHSGMPW